MIGKPVSATPPPLPAGLRRANVDPQLREAAEGMEAAFVNTMLQVMRQSVPKEEGSLDNNATEIYRSMLDSEYAAKAAHAQNLGLAEQIIDYYQRSQYNNSGEQSHAVSNAVSTDRNGTGGTPHESSK